MTTLVRVLQATFELFAFPGFDCSSDPPMLLAVRHVLLHAREFKKRAFRITTTPVLRAKLRRMEQEENPEKPVSGKKTESLGRREKSCNQTSSIEFDSLNEKELKKKPSEMMTEGMKKWKALSPSPPPPPPPEGIHN
ncbi:hypothetical protein RUM44_006165 [Polyplax serrata]|uniref:Uncharacterized protein n=1 Tax=Polyplax serrata TaxID=468196 RepID=A0ABR1AZ42_POLSC